MYSYWCLLKVSSASIAFLCNLVVLQYHFCQRKFLHTHTHTHISNFFYMSLYRQLISYINIVNKCTCNKASTAPSSSTKQLVYYDYLPVWRLICSRYTQSYTLASASMCAIVLKPHTMAKQAIFQSEQEINYRLQRRMQEASEKATSHITN